jgi:hypothetical protein
VPLVRVVATHYDDGLCFAYVSTADFVVVKDGCGHQTVAAHGACQVQVAFRPQGPGDRSAILTLVAAGCGAGSIQATLTGSGVAAVPGLAISPMVVDFGDYCSSKPTVFRVSNVGNETLWPFTVESSSAAFPITKNGCVAALSPGMSCAVEMQFRNEGFGPVAGTLTVSASGTKATARQRGMALGEAGATVIPPQIPATPVGQKSAPLEFIVQNTAGNSALKFTGSISSVAALEYTVIDSDCDRPVPRGSSCRLHIVFAPAAIGVRYASLNVTTDDCPGGFASVALFGVGT